VVARLARELGLPNGTAMPRGERGHGEGLMAQNYTREWLAEALRKLGYFEEAAEAERSLPERFEYDKVEEFSSRCGVSRGELIDRMGGSP
jgi:hypothetical protein